MRCLEVEIDGETIKVWAQKLNGNLWVHFNGETRCYDQLGQRKRGSAGGVGEAASGEVRAPMPGKIIKVAAKVGEEVSKGQLIVVMEAMKMEYSLSSSVDGKLEALNCEAGKQVALGEVLARVANVTD